MQIRLHTQNRSSATRPSNRCSTYHSLLHGEFGRHFSSATVELQHTAHGLRFKPATLHNFSLVVVSNFVESFILIHPLNLLFTRNTLSILTRQLRRLHSSLAGGHWLCGDREFALVLALWSSWILLYGRTKVAINSQPISYPVINGRQEDEHQGNGSMN